MGDEPTNRVRYDGLTVNATDEDWLLHRDRRLRLPRQSQHHDPQDGLASTVEITAWYLCLDGDEETECEAGERDDTLAQGGCRRTGSVHLWTECDGTTDESGALVIRVRLVEDSDAVCQPYTLIIDAT